MSKIAPVPRGGVVVHGTTSTYNNHGCRCALCTEAQRAYAAEYRERQARQARDWQRFTKSWRTRTR